MAGETGFDPENDLEIVLGVETSLAYLMGNRPKTKVESQYYA